MHKIFPIFGLLYYKFWFVCQSLEPRLRPLCHHKCDSLLRFSPCVKFGNWNQRSLK